MKSVTKFMILHGSKVAPPYYKIVRKGERKKDEKNTRLRLFLKIKRCYEGGAMVGPLFGARNKMNSQVL